MCTIILAEVVSGTLYLLNEVQTVVSIDSFSPLGDFKALLMVFMTCSCYTRRGNQLLIILSQRSAGHETLYGDT